MDAPRVDFLLAKSYDPDVRVRRTVSALVGAGFAVRIIAWDRTGRHLTVEDDHGVPIHRVKVRSRPSRGWTQVFYLIRVARRILPLLRQGRPTVLHAVNLPMLGVAVALVPFLGTPRPIIVYDAFEIHALMGVDRYPAWLVRVIALVERYLPRFADLVITPGEDRRRYFEDLGIASVAVPNWIDPPSDLPDRDEARRELDIAEGQFCLVYAGGIIGSRDLQPLVEHARTHPDDLVLIAGSGDAVDELQRAAAGVPNVRLLGWLPDPSRVLAAADGLYYALKPEHPYAKHAAPNNLYQAVALALPLIYREQGELALVGADRRIGIPFSDQSTLAAAVDALRSAATRDAIRRDLQSLRERFRWSAAAGRLVGAYSAVLRPRKRLDELAEPPLLLLTRIWPTRQRPSVGSFIRARAHGVPNLRVVKPRWYGIPRLFIYAVLLFDALRASRRIRGVEAHMLIPTGFVGLLVARLRQVPLVVYAHGRDVRDWQRRAAPLRWLARFVANRADRIVTNSEDTAGYIRAMGVEPIVAPPGADLARFAPSPRPARRGRVLYLGGRNRRKGYAVAADLADTLVGPWLRDVDPDEVPALIAEHDVVLMPSLAEPFGLVAVEAIASGRWVVASAVGGLRDIVIDGVNGTLVEDGDFAGALERIPDYDPHMVARTVERFSLEAWQHELARIWDDLDSRKTDGG